jgi:hypothetical protein
MFALRAHCGRDARGPRSSLEWYRLETQAAVHCGRDARGPSSSIERFPHITTTGSSFRSTVECRLIPGGGSQFR